MVERLSPYTEVLVVDSEWQQDPADLPTRVVQERIDAAVSWSLWRRPKVLYCFECKNRAHDGPCRR
jgi:hypothetical protein